MLAAGEDIREERNIFKMMICLPFSKSQSRRGRACKESQVSQPGQLTLHCSRASRDRTSNGQVKCYYRDNHELCS